MRSSTYLRVLPLLLASFCHGWSAPGRTRRRRSPTQRSMNLFSDLGDLMTGGKLVDQRSLPHGEPLAAVSSQRRTLAVQERLLSFTGEDFDVWDADAQAPYCTVRGALLHLPGKDKMRLKGADGRSLAVLDRKLVAVKPTYDLYRSEGGEKMGWLEKAGLSLTDTFDVHMEASRGGFGPFQSPPAYKLEGDFLDRRFVMKNERGEVVAKVSMDKLLEFDEFDHYQIVVAPGMDAALVVACTCAIDEELEEEHKERKRKLQE